MKNFTLAQLQRLINSPEIEQPTGDSFLDNRYSPEPRLYYRFFYHLAKLLQPGFIVELGGWQGTAAAHFAAGHPKATVITIDHHGDPGDEVHREKMIEASGQYKNLIYLRGWTWDVVDYVRSFEKGIDLLFIDSWHDYEHAMKDWQAYSPLLSSPALVICDDITGDRGPVIDRMDLFWEELPGQKYLDVGRLHPNFPMGLLRYQKEQKSK
jgi:predicted O-methyltransferase YrrM